MNSPETQNLPNFRISDTYSFCNIGLDYAGPLYVREFAKAVAKKVFILLFPCSSSRAVHLEQVPDMSLLRLFVLLKGWFPGKVYRNSSLAITSKLLNQGK